MVASVEGGGPVVEKKQNRREVEEDVKSIESHDVAVECECMEGERRHFLDLQNSCSQFCLGMPSSWCR